MGCGASSSAPQHADDRFDAQDDDDPPPLRTQNSSGSSGPKMVVDVNGHSAYVQVHDEPWNDLTTFNEARHRAELAAQAADAGALRSALRSPEGYRGSLAMLATQQRVIKFSLSSLPAGEASAERAVAVRIRPT